MTYADLILWIEQHFPKADYNVQVSTQRKRQVRDERLMHWDVYVWPQHRTLHVDGHTPEQIVAQLEARLDPPRLPKLDLVNVEKVSA